jgi:hypothetical protein
MEMVLLLLLLLLLLSPSNRLSRSRCGSNRKC